MEMHRRCSLCEESKPNSAFYYDVSVDRYRSDCKDCRKSFERWKYAADPKYAAMHRSKDQYKRDHKLGRYAPTTKDDAS